MTESLEANIRRVYREQAERGVKIDLPTCECGKIFNITSQKWERYPMGTFSTEEDPRLVLKQTCCWECWSKKYGVKWLYLICIYLMRTRMVKIITSFF